jgi:hypothetical protein
MTMYFDLETVEDEKECYLRIPKVWLLDYTPQMITKISNHSFFDLACAYLKYPLDGNLFEETLCRDPYIEADIRDSKFIEKFTEHCLEHKITFSLTGFLAYDWSFYEDYRFKCYEWKIKPNKKPKPPKGFKFF